MSTGADERMPLLNRVQNVQCCATMSRNTMLKTLGVVAGIIFTVVMMIIGGSYMNDCPLQQNIPIFLFVSGFANTILLAASLFLHLHWSKEKFYSKYLVLFEFVFLVLFNLVWNFAGSVWVFGTWGTTNETTCASPPLVFSSVALVAYWFAVLSAIIGLVVRWKLRRHDGEYNIGEATANNVEVTPETIVREATADNVVQ